jgi:hypothetical protein
MKQKLLFIRILWKVIRNKERGWVFFKMTDQQQMDFLNGGKDIDIMIMHMGVDKRVVTKIVERLEKDTDVSHKN